MNKTGFQHEVGALVAEGPRTLSDLSGQARRIAGRLKPQAASDVVRIIRAARDHKLKLHPVSCGRNWGFGSALPAGEDAWLLDLSALNQCHSYDAAAGSIWIEPGVTQLDLYRRLEQEGRGWFFNITGAGSNASVLGNALERGIGYYGQRHLDLIELDVVTGAGERICTRLADAKNETAALLGLDLTALFCQSSLGIVVGARLRLLPRSSGGGGAVIARLRNVSNRDALFGAILDLKREGCIGGVPHIGNRARIVSTMAPWIPGSHLETFRASAPPWTAALPLTGGRRMTEAAAAEIRARLEPFCDLEVVEAAQMPDQSSTSPQEQLKQLASGFPSNLALPGVEWTALGTADIRNLDPEATAAGLIHVTPAIGASVESIRRAVELVESAERDLGLGEFAVTVNLADAHFGVLVISVPFPRKERARGIEAARRLELVLANDGFQPYRIGLGQDAWLGHADPAARRVFDRLKKAFDPDLVLAASKYEAAYRPAKSRADSARNPKAIPMLQEAV